MTRVTRLVLWAVALLVAANISQLGYAALIASRYNALDAAPQNPYVSHLAIGQRVPQLQGSAAAGCRLIGVTSVDCRYCWNNEANWNRLAAVAHDLHCMAIRTSAHAKEIPPAALLAASGSTPVAFVDGRFAEAVHLRMDPTTMIVSPEEKLVWFKEGVLSPRDLSEAELALQNAAKGVRP